MFTNKVSLVSKLGKDIVIMTDDNINSIDLNSLTNQLNNNDLKTIRDDMLIDNDMIIHNDQPTFFRQNFKTCIDHIISNCPNKVTHITTYNKQHTKTNDTMTYNADSSNSNYYSTDDYINDYNDNNDTNMILSDHCILTAIYNDKHIEVPQLFTLIRNDKLLTKDALTEAFNKNTDLRQILTTDDPDQAAEILVTQLTNI